MKYRVAFSAAMLCLASVGGVEPPLPRVWMNTVWREPAEEAIRLCAEQGVELVGTGPVCCNENLQWIGDVF